MNGDVDLEQHGCGVTGLVTPQMSARAGIGQCS